ncbi:tricorn protease [Stackebrandtia endophytica]|uniref:Tricorn protease homolog n=1 Tax=Stackebrandtia endophytica TaxID=1496996 RepID=A0A543ARJ3_9ACTN|nr:S41 family peptidase [Stackebrandtia endophytica]TQL75156.1 tricorn protease [Stackebrandtia endophytica]
MTTGYPRFPVISGNTIVFVAEDDLWQVPAEGGAASRLSVGRAAASEPRISPDRRWIAYTGAEEGAPDVHLIPVGGGEAKRLTYEASAVCKVAGWSRDGESIIYASSAATPSRVETWLRQVPLTGGESTDLGLGRAVSISYGADGATVIGREYWRDFAHWKRYRGGTAGQLWIDPTGSGEFRKLIKLDGNLARPHIIGDRVYFLSDHEGCGNVYSCRFDGTGLRRHSDHEGFYARSLNSDGERLVYHRGGAIYLIDPAEEHPRKLDVDIPVTRTQRARRFVDAGTYLHSHDLSPDGSTLAVTSRGKAFSFGNWEGPAIQHGDTDGTRYRSLTWLHGGDRLVAVSADTEPTESLVVLDAAASTPQRKLSDLDLGRILEIAASPTEDKVALANHRNELLLVDLTGDGTVTVLDRSRYGSMASPTFSPDGQWVAYSAPEQVSQADSASMTAIKLVELATGTVSAAAERVLRDVAPAFDPDGKYLYFIGFREFDPVYDELHFDLGFPTGSRPYAVALRSDVAVPFVAQPAPLVADSSTSDASDSESGDGNEADSPTPSIEVAGITDRVVPIPVPDGRYQRVLGVSGKVLVHSEPIIGMIPSQDGDHKGSVDAVDLSTGKVERYFDGVSEFSIGSDGKTLLYRNGEQLRVVKATEKAPDTSDYSRESGWIDLTRLKVSVRPQLEWPQMFREAWRLLSEHFWTGDMSGVDWEAVYERYSPLVEQVSTREELSDLMWEMAGELGTSHAYEDAGDPRVGPYYGQGFLGADYSVDDRGRYRIERILRGDIWQPGATSPLNRPGVDVREGDVILAVNGQPVDGGPSSTATLGQRLVNLADQEVRLLIGRGDSEPHTAVVKALAGEQELRYRQWVDANRAKVHAATDGKVGYVHIPDMGPKGFAEFHRGFLNEFNRDALLVDVRYNGGGHVSGLLIEKLARRRLAYNVPRWGEPEPYPSESPTGPMVALTNELAGSDGDIFCHSFKQLKLGPLVGTRTWGGVVGYTERAGLSDNTFLSQPEFAFHFDDAKWSIENYGAQPDVEVEFPPHAAAAGEDPQLVKAIELALEELERKPAHRPVVSDRPRLAAPKLPPRPTVD